jgi:hypothetical protein
MGTAVNAGSLGVDFTEVSAFDIQGGLALAALQTSGASLSQLYGIDLTSGAALLIGSIEAGSPITALSVAPVPEPGTVALTLAGLAGLAAVRRVRLRR